MASWELDDHDKMNSQVVDGDDVVDQGVFDHYYHHHQDYLHVHGLSRLATCTTSNSTIASDNFEVAVDDDDDIHGLKTMLTRLSIDDFGGDADEELSEGNNRQDKEDCLSSEYENDKSSASAQAVQQGAASYSLPGTPLQHIRHQSLFRHIKQYSSENETRKSRRSDRRRRWKKRGLRRENMTITDNEEQYSSGGWRESKSGNYFSGESDQSGVLRVITGPKGGDHTLSMDIEEVKACRELGFDLELDMKMMPSLTVSAPVLDSTGGATTSSGGSSPISRWRISSPGDDPKEVKARLKVWAQAVALASTSPRSGGSC